MQDEAKEQEQVTEEAASNQEEKILKPTIASEELLRNNENNNKYKELTAKVEQYNFNQGFRNNKQVNESIVEVKEEMSLTANQSNNEKIDIKLPKKKNKKSDLPILLIFLLAGGGIYYYLNFLNINDFGLENGEQEQDQVEQAKKEKQNKTTCRLAVKMEAQKQNTIIEYIYYDKEEKLKSYEQRVTYEYLEEVPDSIVSECDLTNNESKGYSNVCIKNDKLSYTFKTIVDLTELEEKTLTFNNNTITITASLDDDTSSFKEEYENANYECVTEEVEVTEE